MRATMHKLHTALQPATPLHEDLIDLGEGAQGTVVSFEATDRDCAWCAATSIIDGTSTSWELEAWNGPSVEAPHFYASLEDDGENIEVEVDFRPRLDAGYDLAVEATDATPRGSPSPATPLDWSKTPPWTPTPRNATSAAPVAGSNPRAHDPTTRHTPSGFCPCRCCRTMGDPKPMQSTTSRAVHG